MVWHVYVLMNQEGYHYVGATGRDLQQRLEEHNAGYSRWTRSRRPWQLVHSEAYDNKLLALKRERFFKTTSGRRLRDKLLTGKMSQDSTEISG
jgi:putative endonuclease